MHPHQPRLVDEHLAVGGDGAVEQRLAALLRDARLLRRPDGRDAEEEVEVGLERRAPQQRTQDDQCLGEAAALDQRPRLRRAAGGGHVQRGCRRAPARGAPGRKREQQADADRKGAEKGGEPHCRRPVAPAPAAGRGTAHRDMPHSVKSGVQLLEKRKGGTRPPF